MNANNDILSKVLLDSDFTTYWQHLGIVLICLALVFQAYVLLTLLHEFFRRKMILSRKPAIVENQQENSDANVEFDRLWQEIYPLVFDENGIPRPRTEIKLRKIFHYVKQLQKLKPGRKEELEKLDCLMKNAAYYQKRRFPALNWKIMVLIHLLVFVPALIGFYFMLSPTPMQIVIYIVLAECTALFCIAYIKLLGAVFAVPESLNADFVHPFLAEIYWKLRTLPLLLGRCGSQSMSETCQWLGKEIEKSKRSVIVTDQNGNVLRVEDDTDRVMLSCCAVLIAFGTLLVLLIYLVTVWFYLFAALCVYLIPFVMMYYFLRNYIFYGRFQRTLSVLVILSVICCTVIGGGIFYTAWQKKSAEINAAAAQKAATSSGRTSSVVNANPPATHAPAMNVSSGATTSEKRSTPGSSRPAQSLTADERTRELINLIDAFPRLYQAGVLNFRKIFENNALVFAVDYRVEIAPGNYKTYSEEFRNKLSELGFSSRVVGVGNSILIDYHGSESNPGIFYSASQNIVYQEIVRYYDKKALLCRFDFIDKNGRVRFTQNVSFGTPILFSGGSIKLYPPQNNQLNRTARMRFHFQRTVASLEIDHVQLTLTYGRPGPGTLNESREPIRNQ